MIASTRRIALVPTALMLLAAFTGCKTGSKQTHCTTPCSKTACGDACLSQPPACGSKCDCKVCRCDDRASCGTLGGCRPQCADTKCAIQPNVKCNTGRASVNLGEPSDRAPIKEKSRSPKPEKKTPMKKKPMKKAPKKKKPMKAEPMKKKPMKSAPMKPKKAVPMKKQPMMPPETPKAPPMPKPMPMPKANETDKPFPVPAAPAEAEQNSANHAVNPFRRVSQTEEPRATASASVSWSLNRSGNHAEKATAENREALPSRDDYSPSWADALGLPENQVEHTGHDRRQ